MRHDTVDPAAFSRENNWLKKYYFSRAAFSIAWVLAAFSLGKTVPAAAIALALIYPAWDAVANVADAKRNGGFRKNLPQSLNAVVSAITTAAVAIAPGSGMNAVLIVFGAWASASGIFQTATGVLRWKRHGAQWAMILSGVQSAVAGVIFIHRGRGIEEISIAAIAPYAAFGAFYFLVSAVSLTIAEQRRRRAGRH